MEKETTQPRNPDREHIIELFFDADRNELELPSTKEPLWRVLVWESRAGEKEINPDADYYEPNPGKTFTYTEGIEERKKIALMLKKDGTVRFSKVVPAFKVIDKSKDPNTTYSKHRFHGCEREHWEQSQDFNLGYETPCEEEDITA